MESQNDKSAILTIDGRDYHYYSLPQTARAAGVDLARLPFSLRILLENLVRYDEKEGAARLLAFAAKGEPQGEIAFRPARVLMQDFTGVPVVADLAAMRQRADELGGDAAKINPPVPVDLVIDHSVMVDRWGSPDALAYNIAREYERNQERYQFLRWGGQAFENFRVVPPGAGICHQVNLEYLARAVFVARRGEEDWLWPDTLVGTDSHTTMINGLGILGWGVGGIEAEAAMLAQALPMQIPPVVGVRLSGKLPAGASATDLVLTITQTLRRAGVVGKFVEFYGPALAHLPLEDRATIANMAPEYGATCGFFPFDAAASDYLRRTGRPDSHIALVDAFMTAQHLAARPDDQPVYSERLEIDLSQTEASLAGPKRPQDRVPLTQAADNFKKVLAQDYRRPLPAQITDMTDGAVVIAAITSCTNTSNPKVMLGAGLLAAKARAAGLAVKPWVKPSLAPGSKAVTAYLQKAGLLEDLEALGFNIAGYGCTTCIGNSGPLAADIAAKIKQDELVVCSVLSGNRNFEGRINPHVRANYLASPPLVVAYALAGTLLCDLTREPLGVSGEGEEVFLRDIWPSAQDIDALARSCIKPAMFRATYDKIFTGDEHWQSISQSGGQLYQWQENSTYIRRPPFLDGAGIENKPPHWQGVKKARILALLGDSITTDHISPAGAIAVDSPAGAYLASHQQRQRDFNSYGARRGNHEVMMRGTFANIRIRNQLAGGQEGGLTRLLPDGEIMPIYQAAQAYAAAKTPLVVIAGREYGTGSSRDWAAKGTQLLGVRAVIAQSFERIHRSNLAGMGVLPLQFPEGENAASLGLTGTEIISLADGPLQAGGTVNAVIEYDTGDGKGEKKTLPLLCRLTTEQEIAAFAEGGILPFVLKRLIA